MFEKRALFLDALKNSLKGGFCFGGQKNMAKWVLKRNKAYTEKIAEVFSISQVTANVLANRGLGTKETIEKFLYCPMEDMYDGYLMKDMKKGIDIIENAIKNNKKIVVYGDYDVDGVTSTVILYKTIRHLNGNVSYYLPHRQKEGYGMNIDAIHHLKEENTDVILCCDNGIAAYEEIKEAVFLGMEVVILDHHEAPFETEENGVKHDVLPPASAVIDNKRSDCNYPFKKLCAGGMSYKFSKLLFEKMNREFVFDDEFLSFAAIATICDIVDLMDENRIIAKNGLYKAADCKNKGLKALMAEAGIEGPLREYHAGFIIGPCINATGRLEEAKEAVELFIEEDGKKAMDTAAYLARLNNERKAMTTKAVEEAVENVEKNGLNKDSVLVIYCPDVHESIAGIVAGRVKEIYYKPVILLTKGDKMAKGSARSIESYNIFEELSKCKDLFYKFGGHPMAAGLSLEEKNIDVLRQRLNENSPLTEDDLTEVTRIEQILDFNQITMECAYELERLSPFGKENPSPVFASVGVKCIKVTLMGKNRDMMKMLFKDKNGDYMEGVSFKGYDMFCTEIEKRFTKNEVKRILSGDNIEVEMDILYNISVNRFNGMENIQLTIKDMRF